MTKKTEVAEWNTQASFVFKGTVRKLKATTFKHLPVTDRTVIVKVEKAMRAPDMLEQYVGSEITVQLSEHEKVSAGEQAIFYTQSVMMGDSLVVQSFGHARAGHAPATAAAALAGKAEADPALHEQVANADMVVTGKITSVRTINPDSVRTARGGESFSQISEHDPLWQEAVIEVADVEKGAGTPKEIVVRFPASTDVQWNQAPKFQVGQEGVFLLSRKAAETGSIKRTRAAKQIASEKTCYTALDPAAVQPMQKVEVIRSVIRSQKS